MIEDSRANGFPPDPTLPAGAARDPDRANAVLAIITMLSLSVASLAASWAGYEMIRLKSYKLSVAGSFAIMGAAFACCFAGIPIGIWSLMTLNKPEVASSFE